MTTDKLREGLKRLRIKLDEPFSYKGQKPAVIERVDAIREEIDSLLADSAVKVGSDTDAREDGPARPSDPVVQNAGNVSVPAAAPDSKVDGMGREANRVLGEDAWLEEMEACDTRAKRRTVLRAFAANLKTHWKLAAASAPDLKEKARK